MERDTDAVLVKEKTAKMARVSEKIRIAINVILVIYLVVAIAAIVVSVITESSNSSNVLEIALGIVPRLLTIIIVAVLLVILSKAFQDVSKSHSPFTVKQASRITVMGALLVLNVFVEAIASVCSPMVSELGSVVAGVVSTPLTSIVHIDVMSLVAAIVCFCLSYLFRYGALLQWLQDETL